MKDFEFTPPESLVRYPRIACSFLLIGAFLVGIIAPGVLSFIENIFAVVLFLRINDREEQIYGYLCCATDLLTYINNYDKETKEDN